MVSVVAAVVVPTCPAGFSNSQNGSGAAPPTSPNPRSQPPPLSSADTALIVQRDAGSIRHWPVAEHIWQPPQGEQDAPCAPHRNAVRLRMHMLLLQHPSEQFAGVHGLTTPVPPRPTLPPP